MILHPDRALPEFRSRTERVSVIGSGVDNGLTNFGYFSTQQGICATHSLVITNIVTGISSAQRVEVHNSPGYTIAKNRYRSMFLVDPSSAEFSELISVMGAGPLCAGNIVYNGANYFAVAGGSYLKLFAPDGGRASVTLPVSVYCGCFHGDRLFYRTDGDAYVVHWTGAGYADWTESADGAGHIGLDGAGGEIINMYAFRDRVVALRQYGVTVIRAAGDPRNFAVDRERVHSARTAFGEYAAKCADKLYICSADNIYTFDGTSLEILPIDRREGLHDFSRPCSFGDRYVYCECKTSVDENSYILQYDLVRDSFALFGKNLNNFWRDEQHCYAYNSAYLYTDAYGGEDGDKCWTSVPFDLKTALPKWLKAIYVRGNGNICITVTADGVSRTFNGTGEIPVRMSGRSFTFSVSGDCEVNALDGVWEVPYDV